MKVFIAEQNIIRFKRLLLEAASKQDRDLLNALLENEQCNLNIALAERNAQGLLAENGGLPQGASNGVGPSETANPTIKTSA